MTRTSPEGRLLVPGDYPVGYRIVLGAREHDVAEREWQAKVGP